MYAGTNLFYYSIFETGMSHVYSFFLFACFLYLAPLVLKPSTKQLTHVLFGMVVGLIVAVRPINIVFLPAFFLFNRLGVRDLWKFRFSVIIIIAAAGLVMMPQLFYWKYAYGEFLKDPYENENFSNWCSPKLMQLWFSTNNGLFIYSPLVLFMLLGVFRMKNFSTSFKSMLFVYFIGISLLFSTWHDWSYGCSYGSRPFVEYFTLLSLPFAFFIQEVNSKKYTLIAAGLIVLLLIAWNQKLMFSYDGCWHGGEWDWLSLRNLLTSKTK
jgi:hypothetical protein